MVAPLSLFIIVLCYMALLFVLAYYAEQREQSGRSVINNPYVYALSLAVYCTSWTFYGSVGRAATSGLSFLPIYLGPTIMGALWPIFLKKVVRVAKANRITTISDFISSRYGKSLPLSIVITSVAVVGLIPYIGLQLKAITSTFIIISGKTSWADPAGLLTALMLGAFTIIFGARRLNLSERHSGIVFSIAFESMVKLVAFLLVGVFVSLMLFNGFSDIFARAHTGGYSRLLSLGPGSDTGYAEWFALTFISMMAIVFLPRQFHMAVVENYNEAYIKKAAWLFPLYLFLINIFVLPIALGGILSGESVMYADYFVLTLPLHHGAQWLAVITFIGGFSAATGMVIVESLALSTMVMNSFIMPALFRLQNIPGFPHLVLNIKRLVIVGIILSAYWFIITFGPFEPLVEIGLKSFEAVTLFAPAFILGLYWKKGTARGVIAGIAAGFTVWLYTTIVPVLIRAGVIGPESFISFLTSTDMFNPDSLFGVTSLGRWGNTLFWSFSLNTLLYISVSLFTKPTNEEGLQALVFVESYGGVTSVGRGISYTADDIEETLTRYLGKAAAGDAVQGFLTRKAKQRNELSPEDLSALRDESEKILSGAVGPSMASIIFENRFVLTEQERQDISESIRSFAESLKLSRQELTEANRELLHRAALLRESEEKYRIIAETASDFIITIDAESRILFANPAVEKIFGYTPEEVVGQPVTMLMPERMRAGHNAGMQRYLETGRRHIKWEARELPGLHKNGYEIPLEISYGEFIKDGRRFFTGVIRDISERKQAEKEKEYNALLERFTRELETLVAERTMSLLALRLADKVRNPSSVIGLAGKKLLEKGGCEEKARELIAAIVSEADLLDSTVQDFQSMLTSKRSAFSYEDLNEIVKGIIPIFEKEAAQKHVELVVHLAEQPLRINAQKDFLRMAIFNLARNAMEATPEGGRITIATSGDSNRVVLTVSDTGAGIPQEVIDNIFDPFFTTKAYRFGMGLSLVKQIVAEHLGEVEVESTPGKGTTFRLIFPTRWTEKSQG
ncbi:MAG: PAS domain S-box protein [Nitrospirota bacterium]